VLVVETPCGIRSIIEKCHTIINTMSHVFGGSTKSLEYEWVHSTSFVMVDR
jgi:hypothetical protein